MQIAHDLYKLILATSKIAEGVKQDMHCWKKLHFLSDYSFKGKESSSICIIIKIFRRFNIMWAVYLQLSIYGMQRNV